MNRIPSVEIPKTYWVVFHVGLLWQQSGNPYLISKDHLQFGRKEKAIFFQIISNFNGLCELEISSMADWFPARAKEHSPRQKRQGFLFAQGGLPPLSARRSLSLRSSLRREGGMDIRKLLPALFVFGACSFARATKRPVRTTT